MRDASSKEPAMLPVFVRFRAFREAIPPQLDEESDFVLRTTLGTWRRYYEFLLTIMTRYDAASPGYKKNRRFLMEIAGDAPITPELRDAAVAGLLAVGGNLHQEIERFYSFSKILLDRVADSFGYYFGVKWRKFGSTQTQLEKKFEGLVTGRDLVRDPAYIFDLIKDASARIVKYRAGFIEHPNEPRV